MFNQYFGQYLFNKGLLTAEQIYRAKDLESSVHVKFGVLAINSGLMTVAQVQEIHNRQRHTDNKFGELAVKAGYLTKHQVEELLTTQDREYLHLSQAIINLGYMTLAELEKALLQYKQDSNLDEDQWKLLQAGEMENFGQIFLDFSLVGEDSQTYADYADLLFRSIIRFLDDLPIFDSNYEVETIVSQYWVSQEFFGDDHLSSILVMDEATLLEFARRYSGEEIESDNEMAMDSVGEFLNVVNGIFCINSSDRGRELDLHPQSFGMDAMIHMDHGQCFPIKFSFGEGRLILGKIKK